MPSGVYRSQAIDALGVLIDACMHGTIDDVRSQNRRYNDIIKSGDIHENFEYARDHAIAYFQARASHERGLWEEWSLAKAELFYIKELALRRLHNIMFQN